MTKITETIGMEESFNHLGILADLPLRLERVVPLALLPLPSNITICSKYYRYLLYIIIYILIWNGLSHSPCSRSLVTMRMMMGRRIVKYIDDDDDIEVYNFF